VVHFNRRECSHVTNHKKWSHVEVKMLAFDLGSCAATENPGNTTDPGLELTRSEFARLESVGRCLQQLTRT
jgi:hypothetical protein